MLVEKVAAATSFVAPARWPPTESAAKYHSFRTYYQISVWKSKETLLTATEWGWFVKENSYYPTAVSYTHLDVYKRQKQERPINEEQQDAFLKTCTYLESNDEEQLLVVDLISKMEEYLKESDCKAYDRRHMKRKLEEHYGESVIISGKSGKGDIVTLKETADQILRSYHAKSKDCDPELQKIHIIEAAARLIKSDVKAYERAKKDTYPSTDDLTTEKTMD